MDPSAQRTTSKRALAARLFPLVLAALLLLPQAARASRVERADHQILVDSTVEKIVASFPLSGLTLPAKLATPRDVYLLVTAKASQCEVTALARPEVPADRVARTLQTALAGTDVAPQTILYYTEKGYAAAEATADHGSIGRASGEMDAPVGRMVETFHAAGFTPHVLLRVPVYAKAVGLGVAPYETERYRWYDLSEAPPSESVRISASISPSERWLGLVEVFFAVLMLPFWAAAMLVALRKDRSVPERRRPFFNLVIGGSIGVMAVHAFFMLALVTSHAGRVAGDLWFGDTFAFPGLFGIDIPLMFVAACLNAVVEKRVFGPLEEQPPPMPAPEKATRRRMLAWDLGAGMPFLALGVYTNHALPVRHPYRDNLQMVATFGIVLGPMLVRRLFDRALETDREAAAEGDPDVEREARAVAAPLGVAIPDVRVDASRSAWVSPGITVQKDGTVMVSRRIADALTPEELRFAVAQGVAEAPAQRRMLGSTLLVGLLPALWPVLYVTVLRGHLGFSPPGRMLVMTLPMFLLFLPVVAFMHYRYRGMVIEADRRALAATKDLPAAERAIRALLRVYEEAGAGTSDHRHLDWRLAALRASAHRLGIPTTGSE